ncbi:MAG: hypothetical protein JWO41_304 [Candidatus Saccharibacteria bacterium]|nr:hypothetical protein [Candidatus Saccharibacteria bacterium]
MHVSHRIQTFHNKYPLLGPAFWLLSLQYFLAQLVVSAYWDRPYSWLNNTISDLGNTACGDFNSRFVCSPQYALMNASFILFGVTMLLGSALLYHEFKKSRLSALGFAGMGLAGIGTLLVGVFPENTVAFMHVFGAALPFLIGNISLGLLGRALDIPRPLRIYTVLTCIITLSALVLFVSKHDLSLGIGGMERLVGYPQTLWLIVFGVYTSRNEYRARLAKEK